MHNCDWCDLSGEDKRFLLYESGSWSVFLADEQDYIGRCILVSKRHCGSLSELTDAEWDELRELVRKLEACLKAVLGAALCNWSCLMNSFYKEAAPDPHLHIHVRPRYAKPVTLGGNAYADSEFGHHYALKRNGKIPAGDKEEVFILLREWLDPQPRSASTPTDRAPQSSAHAPGLRQENMTEEAAAQERFGGSND